MRNISEEEKGHQGGRIKVLFIDDHGVLREGLRLLFQTDPGFEVVGEAGQCDEAIALARRERPDVILLDLRLGQADGLGLIPQLLKAAPEARVIILTAVSDSDVHRKAIDLGALGVVMKDSASDVLFKAVRRVHDGEVWLDRRLIGRMFADRVRAVPAPPADGDAEKASKLTAREKQVVELVAGGLRNKEIADRLAVSESTVRHQMTSIFNKLGLENRYDLIVFALQRGLVKSDREE